MTTQDDKPDTNGEAKTQLHSSASDWTLTPKDPEQKDQVISVHGELLLGRVGCDITLNSAHASRKHAKLSLVGGTLRVEDLGSSNGTFVNDERIESRDLKPGDEVRFDTEAFIVGGPAPEPEPAAPDNRTMLRPTPRADKPEPDEESPPAGKSASKKKAKRKKKVETKPPEKHAEPPEPAEPKQPAGEKESPAAKKPEAEETPAEPAATDGPDSGSPEEEPGRRAWYERDTPNMTRKVESGDLRDQFAAGATQIVRGVKGVEMPSLIGTAGDWAGQIIKLDKEAMTIGREDTDIILNEPSVSTKHARIMREGERWKVVDLMSANGVYVNGKKSQVAFLSPGDAVRFGRLEMRFVIDSTEVASRSAGEAEDVIVGSSRASSRSGTWLYVAIGFAVVVVVGAYLLLTG